MEQIASEVSAKICLEPIRYAAGLESAAHLGEVRELFPSVL
jgi:hypothetical protein